MDIKMKSFLKLEQILADHIDPFLVLVLIYFFGLYSYLLRHVQSQLYEETSWLWMQLYQNWIEITIFPLTLLHLPNSFWEEEYSWGQFWLWGSDPNIITSVKSFQLLFPSCAEHTGRHTSKKSSTTVQQNGNTNQKTRDTWTAGVHHTHAITLRVTSLTAKVHQSCFWIPHAPIQAMKKVTKFLKTCWYYSGESNLNLLLECWILIGTIKN